MCCHAWRAPPLLNNGHPLSTLFADFQHIDKAVLITYGSKRKQPIWNCRCCKNPSVHNTIQFPRPLQ